MLQFRRVNQTHQIPIVLCLHDTDYDNLKDAHMPNTLRRSSEQSNRCAIGGEVCVEVCDSACVGSDTCVECDATCVKVTPAWSVTQPCFGSDACVGV